jgi:serine phosphatase RsbU (regulator of sigma subunit)
MDKESSKSTFFKMQKFSSRLVTRVFIVSSIFLIIPLIFYSLIAIREDYSNTKKAIYQAQIELTHEKIHLLEQVIDVEFAAMSAISQLIGTPTASAEEIGQVLRSFVSDTFVLATYYIDNEGQVLSSSLDPLEVVSFAKFIKKNSLDSRHEKVFVATDPRGDTSVFLSQILYDKDQTSIKGYLLFNLKSDWILSAVLLVKGGGHAHSLLIEEDGTIIAATDKEWVGQKIRKGPVSEVYSLKYQGIEYLAVNQPIDDSTLSLLNMVEKRALFTGVQQLAVQFMILLLVIISIGTAIILFLLTRLSQPIHNIQDAMQKVADGDLDFKYKPLPLGFEINTIGEMFNKTIDKLINVMDDARVARVNEEVYHKELSLGQTVQHSLLPILPSDLEGIELAGKFVAAKQVGGDCYDFMPSLRGGRDLFFIADTAGKGIMACLFALNLRSLLRAFCQSGETSKEIVCNTNEIFLYDTKDSGLFVTAWIGLYHRDSREIEYVNVGHLPAILKRANGDIELLSTEGIAFGVIPIEDVEVKKVVVAPGDILYLYTDGITEAVNTEGEFYGIDRLIALIRGIQLKDVNEITEIIYDNVRDFSRGVERVDDLTLMVILYT